MEIIDVNTSRAGTFSSSSVYKLMSRNKAGTGFGTPAITYIKEKRMEKRLGRALETEKNNFAITWGNLNERRVFNMLPTKYILEARTRFAHPTIKEWTGAPDLTEEIMVGDIKCPQLKRFCELVDCMTLPHPKAALLTLKETADDFYWQLVSGSILTNRKRAELVVYCPYREELDAIRELAGTEYGEEIGATWISRLGDEELPFLIKGNHYKNINRFEFDVPAEDRTALTKTIQEAVKLLNAEDLTDEQIKAVKLAA